MPRFRNKRTGWVVEVPEEAPTRQERPKRDKQWADNLTRIARSKRWERVDDDTPLGKPKAKSTRKKAESPSTAQTGGDGGQGDGGKQES